MKNIVVQDCQLDCVYAQISTSPKISAKCDGKAIYAGDLIISISGYVGQGITEGVGADTLHPTSQYVKIDGEKVVLEGDNVTIMVKGVTSGGSYLEVPVTVTIINAGQTSVQGE